MSRLSEEELAAIRTRVASEVTLGRQVPYDDRRKLLAEVDALKKELGLVDNLLEVAGKAHQTCVDEIERLRVSLDAANARAERLESERDEARLLARQLADRDAATKLIAEETLAAWDAEAQPPAEPSPPLAHDWGETEVDWAATRVCKRCGIENVWDHGPNRGGDLYRLGDYASSEDPGCKPAEPKGEPSVPPERSGRT